MPTLVNYLRRKIFASAIVDKLGKIFLDGLFSNKQEKTMDYLGILSRCLRSCLSRGGHFRHRRALADDHIGKITQENGAVDGALEDHIAAIFFVFLTAQQIMNG